MQKSTIYPVILSGGSGTRLWPMSRASFPKQLLALHGEQTMLQETVLRSQFTGAAPPVLLCAERHRFFVAEQLQSVGCSPKAIILEPVGRNTAPAAAVAALYVQQEDPSGILLLMPSDHVVLDTKAFHAAVSKAWTAAEQGSIVTFGMVPERPETGYGYVQVGEELQSAPGVRAVKRFTEKPTLQTAESFIASGDYLWNGGVFLFRADVLLAELERFEPGVVEACRAALSRAKRDLDFVRLDHDAFARATSISVDYAIMERTDKAAVVPCDIGWSDVGAWSALWTLGKQDARGNVLRGDVVVHDSANSLVRSEGKLTALVGVEDLIVIVTPDAVLVADKNAAQDVKVIVDHLQTAQRTELVEHRRVSRPWGSYDVIDTGNGYQVKQIVVKPGGRLSLQSHDKRAEHWVVVQGTAQVTCGEKKFLLNENQSTFIPLGAKHRLENPGDKPLRLIEVQSGPYVGEDDIVRYDDVYGRTEGPGAAS